VRLQKSEPALSAPLPGKRSLSIASRLAVLIFALVAVVSLAVAFELTRREREHYTESKRRAGEMLTELFAASLGPALDFSDTDAVATSLRMLAQNREVVDAAVWAQDGSSPLARLQADTTGPALARGPSVSVFDDHIDIALGVKSPTGKPLGAVAVRVSLARENAAFLTARRRIFWLALPLSAVVAALLVAAVRRTIISPLAALERAARRLSRGELTEVAVARHDEIGSLGHTFNHMGRAIGERELRISAMTARLQGLLDHMRQAIVVFDQAGELGPERSKLAREIFGTDAGPTTHIAELLYPSASASSVEREAFAVWLEEAGADDLDLAELAELAPREVTLPARAGEDRLLELEFLAAAPEDGRKRFMLLATDVTSQRRLERTAETQEREHQKQLNAMRRLLAGGGQVFVRFLANTRERLERARAALSGTRGVPREAVEELFRFVHTLRAEARSFDLKRVEALAAALEVELAGVRHVPAAAAVRETAAAKLGEGFTAIAGELDQAETLFVQSSPIGRRVLEQVTVSRDDVEALYARLGERNDELGRLAARLAARPFGEFVSTLPDSVQRWANSEGKRVELALNGREALVPAALAATLGGVLAHLLRNAVAHGIESPADRRALGKSEIGRIEVSCLERAQGVAIEVRDDGAGFDVEALRRAANGRAQGAGVELAFLSGISTRARPDELAGHGVGLAAVRDDLRKAGYIVRLEGARGSGAQIVIEPGEGRKEAVNG
jgi:two-component system, chemotaxis family, sensor kinase CheA